jgi:hypothetical protein
LTTSSHRAIELLYQIRGWLEGTYTLRIIEDFIDLFLKVSPYLLISIGLNVAAERYFSGREVRFSARNEFAAILSAALLGLVSPLPTYAAIPIGLSLMGAGIPFSAVLAFVIASPLMNPTVFFLTATQLGLEMAIVRTLAAFMLGVLGGVLAAGVFKALAQRIPVRQMPKSRQKVPLKTQVLGNARYMLQYFSIALLLSAAVRALIPPETITQLLGGNARVSTLIAIGMGVPFYTCGGSAIPFMQTLMELGMNKGATLAFFLAGPATKLETLYAYNTMLGGRVLIFFLSLTLIFSYVAGVLYSFV